MSADKRSVFTDALETVGTIITEKEGRDAVHFAVENVVAGQYLSPGAHVHILNGQAFAMPVNEGVGIVDPFLKIGPKPGERFWLFVYPRMITSLRHVWTHPAFDDVQDLPVVTQDDIQEVEEYRVTLAKEWITNYADRLSGKDYDDHYYTVTYDELMSYADTWIGDTKYGGDYLNKGGLLEGVQTEPEFWDHYETIRGKRPSNSEYYGDTPSFFSCSC